jgi:glutathione-regulated potassium-efflux system ancillary protein KefC
MDPLWIAIAFVLGLAVRHAGLPPLVGYLVAGFILHAFGVSSGEVLEEIADLGVTLLLFTIGLKLRIGSLLRPEVWAVASAHMSITVLIFMLLLYALGLAGSALFSSLGVERSLLIAFALSFSSTVFAVKVLEEKGEMGALHGRVSIGILIMQDLFAVLFLAASTGKMPSPWAVLLFALIPLRPLLMALMRRSGHGELLLLYGLLLALGGSAVFDSLGVKGDLGALILGMLLGRDPKASELARSLLGLKDLFLVGFFLSIGLSGAPSPEALGVAVLLALLVPFKAGLFFALLTRFRLRARTSLLASLSLANYSEFGLIVAAIAASSDWIAGEWLVIIAIALSITFVAGSPLNTAAHTLYARFHHGLVRFQRPQRLPGDEPIDAGDAQIVIFGMGRVGTGTYDAMRERHGEVVLGLDYDAEVVRRHRELGRTVILGDATDSDFWEKVQPARSRVKLVMLAMSSHRENLYAAERLAAAGYKGRLAATVKYPDEVGALKAAGADAAFNIYAEAGAGFADHVEAQFHP